MACIRGVLAVAYILIAVQIAGPDSRAEAGLFPFTTVALWVVEFLSN